MRGRIVGRAIAAVVAFVVLILLASVTSPVAVARSLPDKGTSSARTDRRQLPKPAHHTTIVMHTVGAVGARHAIAMQAAPAPSAPFTECPAIGDDSSCGDLVQLTDDGIGVFADPSQGPYDGSDDTLVGVVNDSSESVSGVALASDTDAFGFDGDGICSGEFTGTPAGCPFGPTGYEGPDTSFTDITADQNAGFVQFTTPLAPGQTAYFSLEEALAATSVFGGGPGVDEQGGAPDLSELATTCSTCEPVNTATGAYWHTYTDVAIPGRGVPLNLTRTYSSEQAGVAGMFGFGWADSYGMSLSTDASGDVTVHQENGSSVTFNPNGAGGFTAPPRVLATLTTNPDGSLTFVRDGDHVSDAFTAAGQLLSETDRNGQTTTLGYTGGQLTSVTDPAGRRLVLAYSGAHVSSVTDPLGRKQTYAYDAAGNLVSTTDPLGRVWTFTYDANHDLLTATDPRGGVTTNVYDAAGRVVTQTDPKGAKTSLSYSGTPAAPGGGTTVVTDPNGNVTTETFADLELTSDTEGTGTPQQAVTSYTYDPGSLGTASVTDPNDDTTTHTYDRDGNLLSTTDPLGRVTSYTYNGFDQRTSVTTAAGQTTTQTYDGTGRRTSSTDALGNTTTYAYGDNAQPADVTAVTDPDGRVTTITYDADGDVASTSVTPTSGATDTVSMTYDADGEPVCSASGDAARANIACPSAGTTRRTYDADGELLSTTDADGNTTSTTYDADGNAVSTTDANGNTTAYTFDADNEVTGVQRADGSTLAGGYDPDGDLVTQTDGNGDVTKYAYDALERAVSMTDPLGRTTSYGYDPAGNQTTMTDPSGRTTRTGYDAADEPVSITYSDGSTPDVGYTYDADGQRASMTDGSGTSTYTYDADQRLTGTRNGTGATVGYAYDPAGDLTGLTYPSGQTVTRTFDGAGRLSGVTDWLGDTTTFGYDADGNVTTVAYPNGVRSAADYDAADQVTGIVDSHGASTLASFAYTRDAGGQVTSDTETGTPAVTGPITYTYNALNQLSGTNGTTVGYDKADNPVTVPGGGTQQFDAANELTASSITTSGGSGGSTTAPVLDQIVHGAEQKGAAPITAPALSVKAGNELVLAFVSADGPTGKRQQVTSVTGGGLTWHLASRANQVAGTGTAEVWQADTTAPLTSVVVKATLAQPKFDGAITVATYTGAAAAVGATASAGARKGAPSVAITTTKPDALVVAAGHNWSNATTETPGKGQSILSQVKDTRVNDTYWAQTTVPIQTPGAVTMSDTAPLDGRWELAAVEIQAAGTGGTTTTTTGYAYDRQGDRTTVTQNGATTATLGYDQALRLTSYTSSASTATYAYDGDGLRTAKTVNGTTTRYTWDVSGAAPQLLSDGTSSYVYGPSGQPIEQIAGTTPTYLLADQQGSTRLLTDATGAVVGAYTYGPTGQVIAHTGTATTPMGYAGQYTDAETGFSYLRSRYYDPATSQFITRDPLTSTTGAAYGYGGDDPIDDTDPTGRCWWCLPAAVLVDVAVEFLSDGVATAALPAIDEAIVGTEAVESGALAGEAATADQSAEQLLSTLKPGRDPNVWLVRSDQELDKVYGQLTEGGTPVASPWKNYNGLPAIQRPNGEQVGLRLESRSGGRTIDIRRPGQPACKVHIAQGND